MRLRLPKRFPVRDFRGFCLVNGVHRDEMFRQQRLEALQIVAGIGTFRFRAFDALFGRRHVGLRAVDVGRRHRNRAFERAIFRCSSVICPSNEACSDKALSSAY